MTLGELGGGSPWSEDTGRERRQTSGRSRLLLRVVQEVPSSVLRHPVCFCSRVLWQRRTTLLRRRPPGSTLIYEPPAGVTAGCARPAVWPRACPAPIAEELHASVRLLTLRGPGGIGKTALALHLAHTLSQPGASRFDHVQFVDLSAVREPEQMLGFIAASCPKLVFGTYQNGRFRTSRPAAAPCWSWTTSSNFSPLPQPWETCWPAPTRCS